MPKERNFIHSFSKRKHCQLSVARTSRGKVEERRSDDETPLATASSRKLALGKGQSATDGADDSTAPRETQQWLLVHVAQLNKLVSGLVCPKCSGFGLQVIVDPQNYGFCSSVLLQCSLCEGHDKYYKSVYTSTRLQEESRSDVAFDINIRMVLLAHELGMGYAALKKISKVLGIPALHLKTYQRHNKKVTGRL